MTRCASSCCRWRPRLPFGSNCAANWGLLYDGSARSGSPSTNSTTPPEGEFPADGPTEFGFDFTAHALYDVPGVGSRRRNRGRQPFGRPVRVPVRPHLGVLGVAPGREGSRSSVPPGVFGGNVDNWRFGAGTTVLFRSSRRARFYVGDPHFAQGDGESAARPSRHRSTYSSVLGGRRTFSYAPVAGDGYALVYPWLR